MKEKIYLKLSKLFYALDKYFIEKATKEYLKRIKQL